MKIEISVYWPDSWKSIVLTEKEYQSIIDGNPLEKEGDGYTYEGEDFSDFWSFEGGLDGELEVTYDDGGVGFIGTLSECEIAEIED